MTDASIDTRTVAELLAVYDVVCRTCHRSAFLHEPWCAVGPRPTASVLCAWCGEDDAELGPIGAGDMHAGCAATSERWERDRLAAEANAWAARLGRHDRIAGR